MMSLQGGLTIERMCMLARVSRAGFYRWLTAEAPGEEEMEVRAAIHEVVLEHRGRYGYRRVSRELRRRGLAVNHKRVARLMREDNLLAVQPRAWVRTTDSDHELKVYLNLAARMQLTGTNQLWVAPTSRSSSSAITTASGCTRRLATFRRKSSNRTRPALHPAGWAVARLPA